MKQWKFYLLVLLVSALGSFSAQAKSAAVTDNLKDLFVDLSKRLVPSVVNIYTTQTIASPYGNSSGQQADMYRQFFEQFFGEEAMPEVPQQSRRANSLGTGFIFDDKEGLILTNYHVIADADEIKVILSEEDMDREGIDAKVIGGDAEADVAVLKIKTNRKLQSVTLGNSDELQVGEWVMAIGNPFGHGHTVTKGIISAKERIVPISQFSNFLQTDTPINPGNSGGPLINTAGEVIGINSAINAAAQGIGFAIPINYVKKILPELRTKGVVTRGFIGVNIAEIDPGMARGLGLKPDTRGVLITQVFANEPAAKAGIRPYDVVTEVGGKRVQAGRQLISIVSSMAPGSKLELKILRNGKEVDVDLVVGKRPTRESIAGASPDKKPRARTKLAKEGAKLGLMVEPIDNNIRRELGLSRTVKGVVVSRTVPGSAADEAGLQRGDVIVEVDRVATPSVEKFFSRFKGKKKTFLIRFRRGDGYSITTLDLAKAAKKAPVDEGDEESDAEELQEG